MLGRIITNNPATIAFGINLQAPDRVVDIARLYRPVAQIAMAAAKASVLSLISIFRVEFDVIYTGNSK